jgi:hypothetical protein
LLPVRVRNCKPTGLFASRAHVNLVGLDREAAREVLLKAIEPGRAKPATEPDFPITLGPAVEPEPSFPGPSRPIWNVPHGRNPNFMGRADLLAALDTAFTPGQPVVLAHTHAVHGLGGVGKTQLAVEYAYLHRQDYDVIWWLRSEEPATLAADYAGLAKELGLPEAGEDIDEAVGAVRRWLNHNEARWLLILDNAEALESVRDCIPETGTGHVLITSRNPNWRRIARPLEVEGLPVDDAVSLLFQRSGADVNDEGEQAAARELVAEFDGLPLALEQAAAYVDEAESSLASYLHLYRRRKADLLAEGAPSKKDYPDTVLTTWTLAFQRVEEQMPAAGDLLRLCAFLAPDAIPRDLLSGYAPNLPEPLSTVLNIYEKALGSDHPTFANNLSNLADLLHDQGDLEKARTLQLRSLEILQSALGPENIDVARGLNNLANIYRSEGDTAKIQPLLKRSPEIMERSLGADHVEVQKVRGNVQLALREAEES